MPVEFDDSQFRFAHGKNPKGRGGWAFEFVKGGIALINPDENPDLGELAFVWWVPGGSCLFSEAKKWAHQMADELGADRILVCS